MKIKMLTDEEIELLCNKYGFNYVIWPEKVFIRTSKGEWYFNRKNTSSNIKLYHNNYLYRRGNSRGSKFNCSYHIQDKVFSDQESIFGYIYKHDCVKKKPYVKKNRIEYLFTKIESNRITV